MTYTVTFYDATYRTTEAITVEAKDSAQAIWRASQKCTISAGFRETLSARTEESK